MLASGIAQNIATHRPEIDAFIDAKDGRPLSTDGSSSTETGQVIECQAGASEAGGAGRIITWMPR